MFFSQELKYVRPDVADLVHFTEPFHDEMEFESRWVRSQAKKDGVDENIAKYDGTWSIKEPKNNPMVGDSGLIFSSEAKHGAIAAKLNKPFTFEDKPLIAQYEVRFQNKQECGGAYIKLLAETSSLNIKEFTDKTLYSIMFGPDKCGGDEKLHFIFQHENPITQKMEEKHAKKPKGDFSYIFDDNKTHLITLVIRPDNSFEVLVDKKRVNEGSLLKDTDPSVNPAKEIDDPDDKKPQDWDEREKIPDPDATKPDDWDENAPKNIPDPNGVKPAGWLDDESDLIPDPAAVRPADWDDEEDGEWEAPQINNPKCKAVGCGEWKPQIIQNPAYKGKWTPPLIANPKYKGIWAPRKIQNPAFFEDNNPFAMKSIGAVGFELWSMQSDILFDNIIIADDQEIVNQWTAQTWDLKHSEEVAKEPSAVGSAMKSFMDATNEKPWLWVVVVVAVLIPVILLYVFCFSQGKEDQAAMHKKTDEPMPDDEHDSDKEKEEPEHDSKKEQDSPEGEKTNVEPEEDVVKEKDEEDGEKAVDDAVSEEEKGKEEDEDEEEEEEEAVQDEKNGGSDKEEVQASPSRTRSRKKTRKDN